MATTPFQVEAWTEYAIGLLIIFARIIYRSKLVGTRWEGDDYFAAISIIFWTAELVMLELIGQHGAIAGLTTETAALLSEDQKRHFEIGSKCLLAGWCLYVTLIWCLKACMLCLFKRLTLNTGQKRMVNITMAVCVPAYIATIAVILSHCHPIQRNWQVYPFPGDGCAVGVPNYLALLVTNVSTDMMIVSIPLPLLWRVKMPAIRKMVCGLWLCSGIFVMIATILRCALVLQNKDNINISTIWSIRETFLGIIGVNAPVLGPWIAKNASAIRSKGSKDRSRTGGISSKDEIVTIGQLKQNHRMSRLNPDGRGWTNIDTESEERIMDTKHSPNSTAHMVA